MKKTNLFKKLGVAVVAATMMLGTMVVGVSAEEVYKEGTYSVNANLYVPKEDAPMNVFNAFYTSTAKPPKTGTTAANATLQVASDGTMTLSVPMSSNYLVLKSVGTSASSEIAFAGGEQAAYTCSKTSAHSGVRYTTTKFTIKPTSVEETKEYTFTGCNSHAEIDILTIGDTTILGKDEEINNKRMILDVDFSPAIAESNASEE